MDQPYLGARVHLLKLVKAERQISNGRQRPGRLYHRRRLEAGATWVVGEKGFRLETSTAHERDPLHSARFVLTSGALKIVHRNFDEKFALWYIGHQIIQRRAID
jgi:hypothetical protein